MALEFRKSQKGKDMLFDEGYLFVRERSKDGITYWKCTEYNRGHCSARRCTSDNRISKSTGRHNHVADAAAVGAKNVLAEIKNRARQTHDSGHVAIAEGTAHVSQAVRGKLPIVDFIKRTVRRQRQQNGNYPRNPNSLIELMVPREYSIIINEANRQEELFIQFDSGPGDHRIILFSTRRNLDLLARYIFIL